MEILKQVICFSLEDISLWGARKKLRKEDLQLTNSDALPPKDLASLGSKKIFNPKALSKFEALKKRAHVACSRLGVRFMGGYAVPEAEADNLAKTLDAIGVEFDAEKAKFIANYESELNTWIANHPGWEAWIRAATLPVHDVENRIHYGWTPAKISAPDEQNPGSVLNQKMQKEAGGLAGRLFAEIAEMAEKVLEGSLLGKDKVNRRVLSPIHKIRAKLNGLSFLDKRVTPVLSAIDETLAKMPGDAPIEGLALTALNGLVLVLSSPERTKQYGQAVLDGNPATYAWGIVLPKSSVKVETVAEAPAEAAEKTEESTMGQMAPAGDLFAALDAPVSQESVAAVCLVPEPLVQEPQSASVGAVGTEVPMVKVVAPVKPVQRPAEPPVVVPPIQRAPTPRRVTF